MKNKTILVRMTEGLEEAIRQHANEQDRPVSWVIREALVKYLAEAGIEVKDETPKWGGSRESKTPGN